MMTIIKHNEPKLKTLSVGNILKSEVKNDLWQCPKRKEGTRYEAIK